jgi:hypothetical protein
MVAKLDSKQSSLSKAQAILFEDIDMLCRGVVIYCRPGDVNVMTLKLVSKVLGASTIHNTTRLAYVFIFIVYTRIIWHIHSSRR